MAGREIERDTMQREKQFIRRDILLQRRDISFAPFYLCRRAALVHY